MVETMSSKMVPKGNPVGWSPYVKTYDPLKAGSIDGTDSIPHDNAVIRAMNGVYHPPDNLTVTSNPAHTLFVGRLNLRTSERQLTEEFSKYGQIGSCRVVQDIVTGISRGYGFVEFNREADAKKAWKAAHGSVFHERQILVEWEFARTMPGWIPRRLGGGLGGKKESGQLRFGGRDRPFRRPLIMPSVQGTTVSSPIETSHHDLSYKETGLDGFHGREETTDRIYFETSENDRRCRNSFGEEKRKYRWGTEEKFSDRYYHEEGPRRHRRDSEKYLDNHSNYDQDKGKGKKSTDERYSNQFQNKDKKKFQRDSTQECVSEYYYEDNRRRNRGYARDKNADYEGDGWKYKGDRGIYYEDESKKRPHREDEYSRKSYYTREDFDHEEERRNDRKYRKAKDPGSSTSEKDGFDQSYYDDERRALKKRKREETSGPSYYEMDGFDQSYEEEDRGELKSRREEEYPGQSYYDRKDLEKKKNHPKRKHEDGGFEGYKPSSSSSFHLEREKSTHSKVKIEEANPQDKLYVSRRASQSDICQEDNKYYSKMEKTDASLRRKHRSSSSGSSCSEPSELKRKHKKGKHKRKKYKSDSDDCDVSTQAGHKKHKKLKRKKKKSKKKLKHSDSEDSD